MATTLRAPARHVDDARQAFEGLARWTIEHEYPSRAAFLSGPGLDSFSAYYAGLPSADQGPAVARYLRGLWASEAGWASRWIAARRHPAVLDAGSGFGTFSMLFASVGARVLGVDLRPDRLEVAEQRKVHYQEATGIPLELAYDRRDLTSEWKEDFDMVWTYNAISHIDPLDGFLDQVRRHLRPGGVLAIGDINGAHPEHLRRLSALRTEVHQEYVAPDGRRHAYAVERTFSPRELRESVVRSGFKIVQHQLYARGLNRMPEAWQETLVEPLRRVHWLWPTARRQLLVATSAGPS